MLGGSFGTAANAIGKNCVDASFVLLHLPKLSLPKMAGTTLPLKPASVHTVFGRRLRSRLRGDDVLEQTHKKGADDFSSAPFFVMRDA
jgi:hypothetical protein